MKLLLFAAVLAIIAGLASANATEFSGLPTITDGDTVIVDGHKLRLNGLDAPETDPFCLDGHGANWQCGIAARDALAQRFGKQTWTCGATKKDRYRNVTRQEGHHAHRPEPRQDA